MITTFYPPYHFGGDGIYVQALAHALARRGHEVEVIHCVDAYRASGGRSASRFEARETPRVRVHALRSPAGLLSPILTQQSGLPGLKARAIRDVLLRGFDVVNFHNISLIGGPGVLGLSRAPVNLLTLHEHWLLCPTHILWKDRKKECDGPECLRCCLRSAVPPQLWRYGGLLERSLAHIDTLIAPSHFTAARHRTVFAERPIHVLPSFSPLEPPPEEMDFPPPPPNSYFLYAGRIEESKGIAPLVALFARTPQRQLILAGEGSQRASLERRYAGHHNIRFVGQLGPLEISDCYRRAIAVIVPSLAPEVFPLCVLDALACGTPVIVRDAGGAKEAVEQTAAGFVYRDESALVQAIHQLADDASLRKTLSRRARQGYVRFYSEARYVTRYLALIESLARRKSRLPIAAEAEETADP